MKDSDPDLLFMLVHSVIEYIARDGIVGVPRRRFGAGLCVIQHSATVSFAQHEGKLDMLIRAYNWLLRAVEGMVVASRRFPGCAPAAAYSDGETVIGCDSRWHDQHYLERSRFQD